MSNVIELGGEKVPLTRAPCIRLSVADTVCGSDAATLPRIFEPFFTTKPVGEGTGLGLSMAHGIIAQHGGRIEVESHIGQGPRLRHLPAAAMAGASAD
jgi:signal transduction histidine kinase